MPEKKLPRLVIGQGGSSQNRPAARSGVPRLVIGSPASDELPPSARAASVRPAVSDTEERSQKVAQHHVSASSYGQERGDVLIGTDTHTSEEVWLPYRERDLGVAIIGKSGTGKSSLLEHLILADLEAGTPGIVIDPHGQLADRILGLVRPELAERIFLLEAMRTKPFGLNLLAVRDPIDDDDDPVTWAADSVVATIKKLYGEDDEFLPRLERYLDLAVRTLIPSHGTLLDAPRLFEDKAFRDACLARVIDQQDQAALRRSWAQYDKLRAGERITHTEALVNRLERLLAPPVIRGMVGSRETTVPFDGVLNGNTMLIVSLPSDRLSPERCDFIGALILCGLADRIFARSVISSPSRLHIYLDEYQRFATSTTAELLTQGRKYAAAVTLAHQDIFQITDQRIRNASRHAGTMIALALTRPDADQLAGEYPVEPRREWIETLEEVDGVEPKLIFSPTPAEDIYLNGHSDRIVDKLARSFFAFTPRWTTERVMAELGVTHADADTVAFLGDARKSAGIQPRPGGAAMHPHVQLPAHDVNELLVDAMEGKLVDLNALHKKLLWAETWVPEVRLSLPEDSRFGPWTVPLRDPGVSTLYYYLENGSPSLIAERECDCARYIDRRALRLGERSTTRRTTDWSFHLPDCRAEPLTPEERAWNDTARSVYLEHARAHVDYAVRRWLGWHLDNLEALYRGDYNAVLREADRFMMDNALANNWGGAWEWHADVKMNSKGIADAVQPEDVDIDEATMTIMRTSQEYAEMCEYPRRRVRYLSYLCEALHREPVMVKSGEQQRRMRTRHIVHSSQTEQDALNEFASKLARPAERYVAHVRLPTVYHETRLLAPVGGRADPHQADEVRRRSQATYGVPGRPTDEPDAPPSKGTRRRPPITRRPRDMEHEDAVQPEDEVEPEGETDVE